MTPERWQQISRIFKSAIELDGKARAEFVAGQCGVDDSLRNEVEKLIESHQRASEEQFIGGMAAEVGARFLLDEHEVAEPQKTLNKGQQLGAYVILDTLGAGGMGEVYLAKDSRLDRTIALKVLSHDVSSDKRRMQRFRQEAKVASSLNQPNILTIFEFGEIDGLTFLATEFIDGETLRAHLHRKRLKLVEILDIAIQVLAALDAAHEARIVHRDIKPENVMLRRRDRVVKVLDFGLAKVTEKRSSTQTGLESEAATEFKTTPGVIMGTINYMSPEQAQAGEVDERTDIWSTAVMIYEMVTGTLPFRGATTSHTIVQILEKDPPQLTQVPAELQRIVSKAMAKSPEDRYQTAKDMLIDLRSLKKQLEVEAERERTSAPEMPRPVVAAADAVDPGPKKKRVLAFALIAMAVVTAGVFGVYMWRAARARNAIATPSITNAPPAPVEERVLNYSITVQKYRDGRVFEDPFTIAGEIIFESGYEIRMNLRSPQSGYLYVLNEAPAKGTDLPEFVTLFPSPKSYGGSSVFQSGQTVQIPENSWFKFDKDQGVEKLWLIFAAYEIAELERLKWTINSRQAGLIDNEDDRKKIQKFLNDHGSVKPSFEKGDKETTLKSQGKLLIYPVRLEHY